MYSLAKGLQKALTYNSSMIVKLRTGSFEPGEGQTDTMSSDGASLDKRCLLVYCGEFDSMDGPVSIGLNHLTRLVEEHNNSSNKYSPPLQLDHSTSARDTVGRMVGPLTIADHTLQDGTKVPGLYGTARFLGKENVEKVKDGRWLHLSIGADLEDGKLTELTITPFPAAPEAALLSKKGKQMATTYKIEKYLPAPNDLPKYKYVISIDGKSVFEAKGYDREDEAISDCQKSVKRLEVDSSPNFASDKKMSTQLPGKVDEALWQKAKDASQEAFNEIRYPFVTWWYKENGGKFHSQTSKMSAEVPPELPKGEEKMYEHLKQHLKNLGIEDEKHMGYMKRMHQHLMDEHQMGEEDAHEHMKHMTTDMWDKYAKHMNEKMGTPPGDAPPMSTPTGPAKEPMVDTGSTMDMEHADDPMPHTGPEMDMKHMRSNHQKIIQLAKSFREGMKKVDLVQNRARLSARLSAYKTTAQLTPSEFKKFDITKLSSKSSDFIDGVFHALSNNDPKVFVGLHGTHKAMDVSKFSEEYQKQVRMSKLEKEIRANMTSVNKTPGEDPMGQFPPGGPPGQEKQMGEPSPAHQEPDGDEMHLSEEETHGYEHLKRLIGEGKEDEAKAHLKKLIHSKHLAGDDVPPAAHEEAHEEMKKLHGHFNELIKLTGISA